MQRLASHVTSLVRSEKDDCDCDLGWFDRIVPCGIRDAGVTSLSAETGRTVTVADMLGKHSGDQPEIVLNFITPHQKWGIHSTYTDNLLMLTLSRGGPIAWISEVDAKKAGIADNDWIELYNVNGALAVRAVVSQRVQQGMCLMYHAQEKIVNTPGSEITGTRGGIHNSVTRISLKPTHMIGGYAQLAYGFNYYGTVGSNRDEFLIVRKMKNVDWLDTEETPVGPLPDAVNPAVNAAVREGESS